MIDKLFSLSIKTKITLTIFLIILFLSSGILYLVKNSLTKNLKSSSINITKELIQVNEAFIIKSLLEDDYWSIYNVLKSIDKLDIIKSIGVIDDKNQIIAHTLTDKYHIYQIFDLKNFKGVKIPLMSDDIRLGTCVVNIDDKALGYLFKDTNKQIFIYIIILALISFVIAYFISERILKRLNILAYNAKQIQDGHLDKVIQYRSIEKDEISLFQESMEIILKQLNDAIKNEQKLKLFYHEILKGLNELVVITDDKFFIKYHNEHPFKNIILNQDKFNDEIISRIKQYIDKKINKFVLKIDISDKKSSIYLYVIIENINDMYAFSFTDITKLKNLEEKQQLANSFEIIGEISSSVVHEIKNHMQPIKLLVEQESLDKEDHSRIVDIISRVDQLISDFLNVGKPIDKRLSKYLNLNEVIESNLFLFSHSFDKKNIYLHKEYTTGLKVMIGEYDCEMIIVNLLKNAIEASLYKSKITIKTYQKEGYAVFQITNTGKPIKKDTIKNISKPFFTTKRKGSGLGLYITYKIVYLYGGFIDVFSNEDKTSFSVYLPTKELL
jgi:nitrogen fixation/metabolism regulation signal transduction histidine kinase